MNPIDIIKNVKRLFKMGLTKQQAEVELHKLMSRADLEWGLKKLNWQWPDSHKKKHQS